MGKSYTEHPTFPALLRCNTRMITPFCQPKQVDAHIHKNIAIYPEWAAIPHEIRTCFSHQSVTLLDETAWQAFEQVSLANGTFQYVVLCDEHGKPTSISAFQYVKFDINEAWPYTGSSRRMAQRIADVFIRPHHRLVVGGSVCISGAEGSWAKSKKLAQEALVKAGRYLIDHDPAVFALLLKDFDYHVSYPDFHTFQVDPIMMMNLTAYSDWDQYQSALKSKYRQRLRSAYKYSQDIVSWDLDEAQIDLHAPRIQALLDEVVQDQGSFVLANPTADYIPTLKAELGDRCQVTGYFLHDKLIGFRCAVISGDTLFAHLVGFEKKYAQSHKLYQRMLYDYVQAGISLKAEKVDFGRTAMEIKSTLGAKGVDQHLLIRFRKRWMHKILAPIFQRLTAPVWQARSPLG